MKKMGLNEIRDSYLKFFESKDHYKLASAPVVPKNDKSLLLINAGMAPLKPYFTGLAVPPSKRVASCQKCIRTGDIDSVGLTSRHCTFFEMLGNFSFGDYFKEEIIPWAWEYITKVLEIPKDKLYVTIYLEDDEAKEIWLNKTDISPDRIFRLGKKDNFWEHGVGPCGPCTEIHFDIGAGEIKTSEEFEKASDEDKIIEFWNLVFTQFNKEEDGSYSNLENPNIDTGMGLERIAMIMQGANSVFEVDTIKNILDPICKKANVEYGKDKKTDISLRIITDHLRSMTIMICDEVLPSNEGRGYVLRRILRRAARHGRLLNIEGTFLSELCSIVIKQFADIYPELAMKEAYIKKVINLEEERFDETIDSGIEILEGYISQVKENGEDTLSGESAFKLYDTYGFPVELTIEICDENGIKVDKEAFKVEMQKQRERARAARGEDTYMGTEVKAVDSLENSIFSDFLGYEQIKAEGEVKAIVKDNEFVDSLESGEKGIIVTDKTPFYAEMGGQIGDTGFFASEKVRGTVEDTQKNISDKIVHYIKVDQGRLSVGDKIELSIECERRSNVCKNHTATHIIHSALRSVLGGHVHQKGSYVDENRLRFDFTHFEGMTKEELSKVEKLVNEEIMRANAVITEVMTPSEAKKKDAMALFDDKYGDSVRVVSVGEMSTELCGGTHVKNTGEIGLFKITSESGIASGVRRIEGVTGEKALQYFEERINIIDEITSMIKCNEKDLLNKVSSILGELKDKEKEIKELKSKLSTGALDELLNDAKEINGVKVIIGAVKDIDGEALRELVEKLRDKLQSGFVILGSEANDKAMFVAMASKDVLPKGVHCGKIIKEAASIAGGGGGGRPDMAQAGGKNPEKIPEALLKVEEMLIGMIK